MKRFQIRPSVCFGGGALSALDALAGRRVLVVTDRFLADSGLLDRVRSHLTGPVEVFDEVTPDPSLELVAKGAAVFRTFEPEVVIAFGGGSPLDCAKAVVRFGCPPEQERPLFYAIPTTAGTGSEVTSFAILTHGAVKLPLVEDSLLPDTAILDPAFLAGVPPKVAADTGMDVLTHALEAYVASGADDFTDALAAHAFTLAWQALPGAAAGDQEARSIMLNASCMAGLAFNGAGLGVCHSMAHALGGRFHLAHGRINGILIPAVVAFNSEERTAARKYGRLAQLCGLSGTPRALVSGLNRMRNRLEMPSSLSGAGLDRSEVLEAVPALAEAAMADICLSGNPRPVSRTEVEQLIRGAVAPPQFSC